MIKENRFIGIISTGSYLPGNIVSNKDLEEVVEDTSDELIFGKTGIRARRIADREEATSDLATRAARQAMDRAGISPDEIGLVIVATSSPDTMQPSTACYVQDNLGIPGCAAFDIAAVCSGFVYAVSVASGMMQGNPLLRHALVIGAETYSRILDWADNSTCVFFGDGAGAVILGDVPAGRGVLGYYLRSDGRGAQYIQFPAGGSRLPATKETLEKNLHCFKMDGRKVWDFATKAFPDAVAHVLELTGCKKQDIALIIPHQANARLIEEAVKNLGLGQDKVFINIENYANTSGASVPIALDEAAGSGRIRSNDLVILVGFGGGLTWGACAIRWQ